MLHSCAYGREVRGNEDTDEIPATDIEEAVAPLSIDNGKVRKHSWDAQR